MILYYWKLRRIITAILHFGFSYFIMLDNFISKAPLIIYALTSIICFILYGIDKNISSSGNGKKRIPENTLHFFEFIGGWSGAFTAQIIFKHKTQKRPFVFILYGIAVVHYAGWSFYFYYCFFDCIRG